MTDLPPFDPKPTCPKCGGTRIRVFWQQGITDPVNGRDLPECVIRTCKRCHCDWRELPLDATPAEAESEDSNELDDVYHDRNLLAQLAAVMARKLGYAGGWRDGDDPAWPILTIDLPTGQVSWHVPKDDQLPICRYGQPWDGHTTGEKWLRVERYILSHNEMQPAEPSIPVSRIVAVLAERIDRWTRNSDGASDSRVFWGDLECRAVANELGFTDALDAELARRKRRA